MILSLRKIYAMRIMDLLEKGKKANIGEVRDWKGKKYRKVQNGEWVIVREGHKDKGFHGEEHADVKQHLATHKDTEQSTVAGLRYVVSRDDKGHGHLKVIHNASGTVLAEGSVGGWGNASRVYAHLNHKLGGFDWKKSADALRKDIRENSSMREAVRHVLDNTEKWASNTHSKTLEGADKAEIKTTPKKYAGKKDEEKKPEAPTVDKDGWRKLLNQPASWYEAAGKRNADSMIRAHGSEERALAAAKASFDRHVAGNYKTDIEANITAQAEATYLELKRRVEDKKPEVPKSEHKLTVGKTPDVAPSAKYDRKYQLHLQQLHDKIQAADADEKGYKEITVGLAPYGGGLYSEDELNHDLRKLGKVAVHYDKAKGIAQIDDGTANVSKHHAAYEAVRAAKPKTEAPKEEAKPAEKKLPEHITIGGAENSEQVNALIDKEIQSRLEGGERGITPTHLTYSLGEGLTSLGKDENKLKIAAALGVKVPAGYNDDYATGRGDVKLKGDDIKTHYKARDELEMRIQKKLQQRIEKLTAAHKERKAKEFAAQPEPTAKVEVKLSKKEEAERGLHNVAFNGKELHKHAVTDTENMKRPLHGIHHDTETGHIVSTNGKAMVALKAEPKELEHINAAKKAAGFNAEQHAGIDASGQAIEGKYPKWTQVIPDHEKKAVIDWKGEHAKLSEAFSGMKKKAQAIRQELIDEKAKGFADRKMAEKAVDRDIKHGRYAPSDSEEGKKIRMYQALSGKGGGYNHVPHVAYHTVSPEGKIEFHAVDLEKVKPSKNGEIDNAAINAHLAEKGITHKYNWDVLNQPLKIMATHRPHDTSGAWVGKGDRQIPHAFKTKGDSHFVVMPMKVQED